MQSKGENEVKNEVSMDSEYLRILSETLESGISILDENMNYLYLSDSVYSDIGATRDQLKPGDPLSKCHDIMFENGLLSPEILKQQELSAEKQKLRNAEGAEEGLRLLTLGDGTTYRFVRKHLSCGKTVSIADNVSELVEKEILLDKALALGNAGYWSYDVAAKTYTLMSDVACNLCRQLYCENIVCLLYTSPSPRD